MSAAANSISATAAAEDWDVELDGPAPTFLVFTLCVVDPLQVERVSNRFIAFVDTEYSLVSISQGMQGGNPYYATITEQRERINNLIRTLNNVNLHLSTSVAVSQYVSSVLLADGGNDNDDNDDDNNDDIDVDDENSNIGVYDWDKELYGQSPDDLGSSDDGGNDANIKD
jgi:hypothetical protein